VVIAAGTPPPWRDLRAALGESTDEVFAAPGYAGAGIEALRDEDAIGWRVDPRRGPERGVFRRGFVARPHGWGVSSSPETRRTDALEGLRDGLPVLLGTVPYALVMGVAAASAGLTPSQAAGLSALVFAGLSQLAAVDLIDQGASVAVVVATALIINARFAMYSASIAPHLERLGRAWRWLCPFFLIGPVYAVALAAYEAGRPTHYGWYMLGLAVPSWVAWVAGTVVGIVVGAGIPDEWQLGFAVPLVFVAIVTQFIEDRGTVAAAVVAGGVSVGVVGLPFGTGLLVAGVAGVLAGTVVEWGGPESGDGSGSEGGKGSGNGNADGDGGGSAGEGRP
jgi:predicted branched-subunit amino acid permease